MGQRHVHLLKSFRIEIFHGMPSHSWENKKCGSQEFSWKVYLHINIYFPVSIESLNPSISGPSYESKLCYTNFSVNCPWQLSYAPIWTRKKAKKKKKTITELRNRKEVIIWMMKRKHSYSLIYLFLVQEYWLIGPTQTRIYSKSCFSLYVCHVKSKSFQI